MNYKVYDNLTGEILTFTTREQAEKVAKQRLDRHIKGYDIRHQHIYGCDARLIEKENKFIIELEKE